ncbi:MAG: DUF192 domain-containing protein [Candidatus Omnitrophota bacterium]
MKYKPVNLNTSGVKYHYIPRVEIINKTKNLILAEDVFLADTVLKRLKGLLGKKEFKNGQAVILKPCSSIHTLFMCFPIDVLFVDKHNRVIKAISNLPPFRLSGVYLNADFAIELPAGMIGQTATAEGDSLQIK